MLSLSLALYKLTWSLNLFILQVHSRYWNNSNRHKVSYNYTLFMFLDISMNCIDLVTIQIMHFTRCVQLHCNNKEPKMNICFTCINYTG